MDFTTQKIKHLTYLIVLTWTFFSCEAQTTNNTDVFVGGPCEGCQAIFEYGDRLLEPTDTLPGFVTSQHKLKIEGTVYQKDGKTPAENVIIYVYHTNREGIYEKKGDETGWARRHGFIRGWVKTQQNGKYAFYTFRPASYPGRTEPEHVHITVKEPDRNAYYIDDIVFEDDPLLTQARQTNLRNRAGSEAVLPVLKDGILTVKRDIVLGLNIENYP